MDLFDYSRDKQLKKEAPLAERMRPRTLEEFIGQEHIIAPGKMLYRAIKADKLSSIILYGPPGTGKTTLARIIANTTKSHFEQLSAVTAGVADIRKIIDEAKQRLGMYGQHTILFIDEIHRFNKSQQDALLPHVEAGTIVLIGATTENPYFEVNSALLSRSTVFELYPLKEEHLKKILKSALTDKERGLGNYRIDITEETIDHIVNMADGDARSVLNALELAFLTTSPSEDGVIHIDLSVAEECIQRRAVRYDKTGDNHYDTISAFIKSMRGSDPDAAVYWLAKMINAGEDPKFIARRIVICASEDVGNADPRALVVAMAAADAVQFIGMPESQIILTQAATYIACAPKSNATVMAIDKALADVKNKRDTGVPNHLKDASYDGDGKLGHGVGYKYAHDYPGHYVKQQYLPDSLTGTIYYEPSDNGYEKQIKDYLDRIRSEKNLL